MWNVNYDILAGKKQYIETIELSQELDVILEERRVKILKKSNFCEISRHNKCLESKYITLN